MSDHRSKIEEEMGPEASDVSAAAGFVPITDLSPGDETGRVGDGATGRPDGTQRVPPLSLFAPSPTRPIAPSRPQPLDLAAIRERLAGKQGRRYWQSLEEL